MARRVRRVRRVVIISDLSDPKDGPSIIANSLAKSVQAAGIDVDYVCGQAGDNESLVAAGVNVVPLNQSALDPAKPYESISRGLFNKKIFAALSAHIKDHDTDCTIYHVHNWSKILSPSIFLALAPVAARTIITAHDYFVACPNGGFFNYNRRELCELTPLSIECLTTNCDRRSYSQKIWRVIRASGIRRYLNLPTGCPTIAAVHEGMLPYLRRAGFPESRLVVLRNPFTAWTAQRVEAENNRSLLFVGRLDHDKGADLLARAAANAKVDVTFIGDGPLRAQLQLRYPEFQYVGWKEKAEIQDYARKARLAVIPSASRETFSLAAFEALSSGIPVVLSEFATTAGQIVDNGLGFAINPYETEAFGALIGKLQSDDALVREVSLRCWAARATIASTVHSRSQETIELYNRLLDKHSVTVAGCA
jgi:glycosyltransferase involved in cell wall biosynthesis